MLILYHATNMNKAFENIERKGENVGDQHFLLFLFCLQNVSHSGSLKTRDCMVKR